MVMVFSVAVLEEAVSEDVVVLTVDAVAVVVLIKKMHTTMLVKKRENLFIHITSF
jgi:hypothetical protein